LPFAHIYGKVDHVRFDEIDRTAEYNQGKVLRAMQKNKVNATLLRRHHRLRLQRRWAATRWKRSTPTCFHTEAALVGPQITCGTHALTVALSANLLPGDELLSPVGAPYDTLEEVIGIRESKCSLKEYGVTYAQAELKADGAFDYDAIRAAVNPRKDKAHHHPALQGLRHPPLLQRGADRRAHRLLQEGQARRQGAWWTTATANLWSALEPSDVGADMVVGSLIKNPGGGLAPIGGYICGTRVRGALRLPPLGPGPGAGGRRQSGPAARVLPGAVSGPHRVSGALKGAVFAAERL
jgi:cystathionine beta-lyase family protein involved in aluminum resistance